MAGIVSNPALHAECKAALPGLIADRDAAMAKITSDKLTRILGRAMMIYGQPERTDGEWKEWIAIYQETLGDLSARSVEMAMNNWIKTSAAFMPKPGELREMALKVPCPEYQVAYRARLAAEAPKAVTVLDAAERRAQIAEALAGLKGKTI